jgi:hypothetical protein
MAVGFPTKTTYANGDVFSASDINDTNGTINLLTSSTLSVAAAKNMVINGAADFWQRGTTFTNTVGYTADRWYQAASSVTTTQETTIVPTGFRYSVKGTTTATTQPYWMQAIETANAIRYAGQTVTLSYYAATSNSSNVLIRLDYSTNVDEAIAGTYTTITSNSVAATATMSRVSATFAVPSTAKTLRVLIGAAGSQTIGVTTSFTGVQIELGSTATTFSRAGGTIQGELAACQRYYWRNTPGTAYGGHSGIAITNSSTSINIVFNNPTSMRIAPTSIDFGNLAVFDTSVVTAISSLSIVSSQSSIGTTYVSAGGTGLGSLGRVQYVLNNNNTAGYFGASAEL